MEEDTSKSPHWSSTTKAIVGLTVVAVTAGLLVQFRNIIGPLILAFMLSYLLHPVAKKLSDNEKISWRTAVNLIFLLLLILVLGMFTATGVAIVQQLQSLIGFVQRNVTNLPGLVADLSNRAFHIGPFDFNLAQFDLQALFDQLLSWVQPLLGRAGGIISTVAASAAVTVGWGLFVLIISYFLLADADRVSDELVHIDVPGYNQDLRRLGIELRKTWNAFLRGQLTITLLIMISYFVLMGVTGMRFAIGIAILAGLGRFVPYLGPLVLWITTALVAYFQGGNYFGLQPLAYAILVLGLAFTIDQVFDNLVAPRVMGQTLGVHPAAVLVTAIVAARLIGLIGLLLAAPVVASLKLLAGYVVRKMFDLDPWPSSEDAVSTPEMPWSRWLERLRKWWALIKERLPDPGRPNRQ
jgi:predicted PurR-regulated permease PerM